MFKVEAALHRVWIVFLITFLFLSPCRGGTLPFQVGEKLTYDVIYFGVVAGTATLEVKEVTKFEGHQVYHLQATARSTPFFSRFYRVDDRIEALVDVETLLPYRFESHRREGKHSSDEVTIYYRNRGEARYREEVFEIPSDVHDPLSCLYVLRTKEPQAGRSVIIPANVGKKHYRVEVKVLKKQRIKKRGHKYDTVVVRPVVEKVKLGGIMEKKGRVHIWLTDDERRIPVFIKAKVVIGSLHLVLVEMQPGGEG